MTALFHIQLPSAGDGHVQAEQLKQRAESVRAELTQKLQDTQDQHSKTRASLASQAAGLAAQVTLSIWLTGRLDGA